MKARYVEVAGTRASLRAYWDEHVFDPRKGIYTGKNTCPNSYGHGHPGVHDAMVHLVDSVIGQRDYDLGGLLSDYEGARWPNTCDHCGAKAPDVAPAQTFDERQRDGWILEHQLFRQTLYATPDRSWYGLPQVGDLLYEDWFNCATERNGKCIHGWTNCGGAHLIAIVPTGHWWDLDARASNCSRRDDTTHRCWVRHGDPAKGEAVHVDKTGATCQAGAGSLAITGWHGFLHRGDIHESCTTTCRR